MKNRIIIFVCSIAAALTAAAQVPSLINYQGRLTDSNGAPVTGSKNFAISIYDAATGGNLLYEETIGAVTLDANGVYSFQFGSAGSSNTQVTETIGTTAGSTLTYTKTLTNTPVVNNSITVTDGTNSWSQSVGNPGVGATATANTIVGFVIGATITNGGSGYTTAPEVTITGAGSGATATATLTNGVVTGITINSAGSGYSGAVTISIAPPVIPFRVDYSGGAITATYSSAPTAGQTISATYRYTTSGIAGALSAGAEHWMALSVDGVAQAARQRVLAVPFASRANVASRAIVSATAESLTEQIRQWRPAALISTSVNDGGKPGWALPMGLAYFGSGGGSSTCEAVIPANFKSISNIDFDIFIGFDQGRKSSAVFSIVRYKSDVPEEILITYTRTSSSESNGRLKSSHPVSIMLDQNYVYKLKLSASREWAGLPVEITDIKLTVTE
jgi:hypothetical protein